MTPRTAHHAAALAAMRLVQGPLRRAARAEAPGIRRRPALAWRRGRLAGPTASPAPARRESRLDVLHRLELSLRWSFQTALSRPFVTTRPLRFVERERRVETQALVHTGQARDGHADPAARHFRQAARAAAPAEPRLAARIRRLAAQVRPASMSRRPPSAAAPHARGAARRDPAWPIVSRRRAVAATAAAGPNPAARRPPDRLSPGRAPPRGGRSVLLASRHRPFQAVRPAPARAPGRPERRLTARRFASHPETRPVAAAMERPARAGRAPTLAWRAAEGPRAQSPQLAAQASPVAQAAQADTRRPAAPDRRVPTDVVLPRASVERLADDVMARIERKLRIERERRGL